MSQCHSSRHCGWQYRLHGCRLEIRCTGEETEYVTCCLSESYDALKLARCSGLEKSTDQAVDRPVG